MSGKQAPLIPISKFDYDPIDTTNVGTKVPDLLKQTQLTAESFPTAENDLPGNHIIDFTRFSQSIYREGNYMYGIDGDTKIVYDENWKPTTDTELQSCYGLGNIENCETALEEILNSKSTSPLYDFSLFIMNLSLAKSINPVLVLRILHSFGFRKIQEQRLDSQNKSYTHNFIESAEAMLVRINDQLAPGNSIILDKLNLLVDYINQNPIILNPGWKQDSPRVAIMLPNIKPYSRELQQLPKPFVPFPGDEWMSVRDNITTLGGLIRQKTFPPPGVNITHHIDTMGAPAPQAGGVPISTGTTILNRNACSAFWQSAFDYIFNTPGVNISPQTRDSIAKAIAQLDECEKQLVQIFQGLSIANSDRERDVLFAKGQKRGLQLEARVGWLVNCATQILPKPTVSSIF